MADGKRTARTPRSRSAPKVVSPRSKVNVNVSLPFSSIAAEEPMRVGDWISLAGLAISVIGFSAAIWQQRQLIRIANALQEDQASHRANREEADSLAGRSSSA